MINSQNSGFFFFSRIQWEHYLHHQRQQDRACNTELVATTKQTRSAWVSATFCLVWAPFCGGCRVLPFCTNPAENTEMQTPTWGDRPRGTPSACFHKSAGEVKNWKPWQMRLWPYQTLKEYSCLIWSPCGSWYSVRAYFKIKEYGILRETHTPTVTSLCAIYLIFTICRVAVCPLWLLLTCPTSDRQRMQGMITASHWTQLNVFCWLIFIWVYIT